MSYFERIILPSVKIPVKPSYSIEEATKILECSRRTLTRMAERGQIKITTNKRIYLLEFVSFFNPAVTTPDV